MANRKHPEGLTNEQVSASRSEHGDNLLTPSEKRPVWKLFLEKFEDPVIRILLVAAFLSLGISFIEREFAETIGIFCAIFLSTGISFWFEYDAEKKFDLLGTIDNDTAYKVIRNGKLQDIKKKDIVVGDIVLLETGEEIPADGKILDSVSLSVDESALTGELLVTKSADPTEADSEATYPSDMLYRGTSVTEGHCTMEITSVGDATEFGKVARQSTIKPDEKTPLTLQLDTLAKFIGVIGFSLALLTFIALFSKNLINREITYTFSQLWLMISAALGGVFMLVKVWAPIVYDAFDLLGKEKQLPRLVRDWGWLSWMLTGVAIFLVLCATGYLFFGIDPLASDSWIPLDEANRILQYFMIAVTLIVVAVPEGLPMSVTLSLALSMRRMMKSNNLVRKMHACETMGAATVICTDKTGTLTQNRMHVHEAIFYPFPGPEIPGDPTGDRIRQGIAVNTTAFLRESESGEREPVGNPTEGALLLWLESQGADYEAWRDSAEIIDQLPFNTERKYMATLVAGETGNILYIKGAPEIVFGYCRHILGTDGKAATASYKDQVDTELAGYQNRAMRTLGFAMAEVGRDVTECEEAMRIGDLGFIGVAAISDPVREDVPEAVRQCLDAGIAVKIVTGDTPGTAREIGRQVGLWTDDDSELNHITGAEFEKLSDDILLQRVGDLKIMSRARPTDKQRLVKLLQQRGEVVAVTGDGTNDAPALNFAQVGISMGSGTYVAKEASDITLLDDSFSSIATAVMWGRSLYRNIQRFIVFQLTINFTALIIVLLGSIFGAELPLTVTQMLWVNLIMDTFAAGALASLPPDPKVMRDKPRIKSAFIITPAMSRNIIGTGSFFVVVLTGLLVLFGRDVSIFELTVFFTAFVMFQVWNLFNAKVFGTNDPALCGLNACRSFLMVVLLIVIGQFIIVQYAGEVFRTVPLDWKDWSIITAATSVVLCGGEIFRTYKRSRATNAPSIRD